MAHYILLCGIQIALALIIDHLLGEPSKFHPLVGFGNLCQRVELHFNTSDVYGVSYQISIGLLATLIVTVPCVLMVYLVIGLIEPNSLLLIVLNIFVLYLAIGQKSLADHGHNIARSLKEKKIKHARQHLGLIVSRNTDEADETDIARSATESMLENGNDAVFAALFWFVIAGAPGVVLFRLVNTLDAMWGYKNKRYLYFGRTAAKLDDFMNYVPARLCAITFALFGNTKKALRSWRHQAHLHISPNGGAVMAAGAGALEIVLGGPAKYEGQWTDKVWLGEGREPSFDDIYRASAMVRKGSAAWAGLLIITGWWFL